MFDITDWFLAQDINFEGFKSFCETKICMPVGVTRTLEKDTELPTEDLPIASSGLFIASKPFEFYRNSHVQDMLKIFTNEFGTSKISGALYYPPQGFMGWHTNSNYPGTRIYVSYSREANSNSFSYIKDDEVVQSFDRVGFTVRMFKVTDSQLFWHRVDARSPRFSLGFKSL